MTRESVNKGKQLQLARGYRGWSPSRLAGRVKGLSAIDIHRFESGLDNLKEETVSKLMIALYFPLSFLDKKHPYVEFIS